MATEPSRTFQLEQEQPVARGFALTVLSAITEAISPAEADILAEPLREAASSFAACAPGSLFAEWAPLRRRTMAPVSLHKAHAFASSAKDSSPALAALGSDASAAWVSAKSKTPNTWTLHMDKVLQGPMQLEVTVGTEHSAVKPATATLEASIDGVAFAPVGAPFTLKGDDDKAKDAATSDDLESDPFAARAAGVLEADEDVVCLAIPAGRRFRFLRVSLSGQAGSTTDDAVVHSIVTVALLRPDPSPFALSTGASLAAVLQACEVAGGSSAPERARTAAVETALAVAAATASPQAAAVALGLAMNHLAAGGTTLPGTVGASIRALAVAASSAAAESRDLAIRSGAAPASASALVEVASSGGDGPEALPKFDSRHHGSNCRFESGDRVWCSTGSSDNYGMATTGVRKGVATWEFEIVSDNHGDEQTCVGFVRRPVSDHRYQNSDDMWMVRCYNGGVYHNGMSSSVSNIHPGNVVRFKANMTAGTVHMWIDDEPQNGGDPVFTGLTGQTIYPAVCGYSRDKTIRFKSFKTEGSGSGAKGLVALVTAANSTFMSAVEDAPGVSAPGMGASDEPGADGAKAKPVLVAGMPRKDAVVFRPGLDKDGTAAAAAAAATPAILAPPTGPVSLSFGPSPAVSTCKPKLPSGLVPRLFMASFGCAPGASLSASAAPSVVDVSVDGKVVWRSPRLHALPARSGLAEGAASLAPCRVAISASSSVTVTVRACAGPKSKTATPVAMVLGGFAMGKAEFELTEVSPDPHAACVELLGADAVVSPPLCRGGAMDATGTLLAAVPTAQVLTETAVIIEEAVRAEAMLTRAAVEVVGVGARKAAAKDSNDAPAGADEDEGAAETEKDLCKAVMRLETPCCLDTSDDGIGALAAALDRAASIATSAKDLIPVIERVVSVLAHQAGAVLARIEASGIRPADLGVTLPGRAAKAASSAGPGAAAAAAGAAPGAGSGSSAASVDGSPLNALRLALSRVDNSVDDAGEQVFAKASVASVSAMDAGTTLFYPTKALRRELLALLLGRGGTLELQFRFPTLTANAVEQAFGAKIAKNAKSVIASGLLERPAEAHPSLRDGRFDRAFLLIQAEAEAAGFETRVVGDWGASLHLTIALPPAKSTESASVRFIESTMRDCMSRAGMGLWRFPSGCRTPRVSLQIHRSADLPAGARTLSPLGCAAVRLFPASAGPFAEISSGIATVASDARTAMAASLATAKAQAAEAEARAASGSA
ncbi:hypothetical protein FNF27_05808 [Cafeteria roenbergensis]|uniref:B30.2/SPRY domain-containing protein n=1 Tax=Cafeteria roenbergensis TaxID=33653 RepID=A0A5A8E5U3_CAFRO|nr:hypothetical protein FNF27_05808 [Cafeteria roenbergensis]